MVISNKFAASILSVSMKMQPSNTTDHDYGCTTGRDGRLSSAMVNLSSDLLTNSLRSPQLKPTLVTQMDPVVTVGRSRNCIS